LTKAWVSLAVGVVFLGGLGLLLYMFGRVETKGQTRQATIKVWARFDEAGGLVRNSHVTISGIPVGSIDEIGLDPEDLTRARVVVKVEERLGLREGTRDATGEWRNGTEIRRVQGSLLGDFYLEIVPGLEGRVIPDGGQIRNVVTHSGVEAMLRKLDAASGMFPAIQRAAENIGAVTDNLRTTLGGPEGAARMEQIAEDVARAAANIADLSREVKAFSSANLAGRSQEFGQIVDNVNVFAGNAARFSVEASQSLSHSLENLRQITEDLRAIVAEEAQPGAERRLGTVRGSLEKIERDLDTLQETLEKIRSVATKVDEGQGTVGRLVNDDRLIDAVETTAEGAGEFVAKISRLQTWVGAHTDYYYNARAFRTAIDLRLQPTDDKYYALELISDPRGLLTRTRTTTVTDDPNLNRVTHSESLEVTDRLRFSLYLAKRFWFMTWRFGIIENTGGVGVDLEFLNRHLALSAEAFGVGMQVNPHLRSWFGFRFLKYLFVSVGLDDPFNAGTLDYFGGLGIRFNDQDLKTLFTTAPSVSF
jgi:phospholipid/cholesterol/gamma-HCH transport system substrate-binding protein